MFALIFLSVAGSIIEVRDEAPSKAERPMLTRLEDGNFTYSRLEQFANERDAMWHRPSLRE